jgi:hypothetical protein
MLRRAFGSLKRNMPYLFTYKAFERLKIPAQRIAAMGILTTLREE